MRTKTILLYFLLLIPGFISAQKFTGNYVYSTSSLNFYPAFEPYTFDKNLEWTLRDLDLTFLTVNSGTFVLEEDETLRVENTTESTAISPLFNFGAGFQIRNPNNSRFQEVSISRLSRVKTTFKDTYMISGGDTTTQVIIEGSQQKNFLISLRYEYGKVFGKRGNPVRFGVSGMLEPSFYSYKRDVFDFREFPLRANIFSLRIALVPSLSFRLSKKVYLDWKVIPSFLIADFGNTRITDPTLPISLQSGERSYNLPDIDLASTIQLRYVLKEPKRRRRRSSDQNEEKN